MSLKKFRNKLIILQGTKGANMTEFSIKNVPLGSHSKKKIAQNSLFCKEHRQEYLGRQFTL